MDAAHGLATLALMVAILLGFAAFVAFVAIMWLGLAEGFRRRKKPPWEFTHDAERLHHLVHPEDTEPKR